MAYRFYADIPNRTASCHNETGQQTGRQPMALPATREKMQLQAEGFLWHVADLQESQFKKK